MKTLHKFFPVTFIVLAIFALFTGPLQAGNPREALIIFEESSPKETASVESIHMANLLGHFGMTGRQVSALRYTKGEMASYDAIFFIGSQKSYAIKASLIGELRGFRGRLFWLGNHLDQLMEAGRAKTLGMEWKGTLEGIDSVSYRGSLLSKGVPTVNEITADKSVTVLAWAKKGEKSFPYIAHNGSFWYIADVPFTFYDEAQRYLAFCDVLHDFLSISHPEHHRAVVRIEDVNPTTSPESIRQIADMLWSLKVPFLISLVPEYHGPYWPEPLPLSSRPQLVEALQYAVSKGGTITLHGYTHQYTGASTIDYEFWDEKKNGPVREDSAEYVEGRLRRALDECYRCHLYPLLWSTPHYVASMIDYRTLAKHFTTVSERRIYLNQYYARQSFPFIIEKDVYGQRIIPEYLGFVPFVAGEKSQNIEEERKGAAKLVDTAMTMNCVRDSVAGFFFHPFIDASVLKDMILSMKSKGFEFLDVRGFDNAMTFEDKAVVSGKGKVAIKLSGTFLREFYLDDRGNEKKETMSPTMLSKTMERQINAPQDWIYVAEGITAGHESARVALLWKKNAQGREMRDQEAFVATIASLGIEMRKIESLAALQDENVLIIPYASALELRSTEYKTVADYVKKGGILLTDGPTKLAQSLGFRSAGKPVIKGVKDLYNKLDFYTSGVMEAVSPEADDTVVFQAVNGPVLGVVRKGKSGGIVYLSTLYDPDSGRGYSRFPTLVNILLGSFDIHPPAFAPRLEAYFDPGLRQDVSVEVLAKRWRQTGIRYIHVGGWHFYQNWSYNYKLLISECHKRGIAVYAWLELPYLTKDFWEKNPQFREKNYMGGDVQNFWRYPLALEEPTCRKAVFAELKKLFTDYDFDGVNLAELYFENEGEGMSNVKTLSPFHPWALKAFQDKYKFDMREIFNTESPHYFKKNDKSVRAFYDFRADLIFSLHKDFIGFLEQIRKEKKNFDIVITVVDSLEYPKAIENWGVDAKRIASLMKDSPFTLMVEDPYTMWDLSPERYEHIKKAYHAIGVPPSKLALNLNVVDIHKQGFGFAYSKQTGTELYQMLRAASSSGHRVISYAEATIPEHDLPYIGYVMEPPKGAVLPAPEKGFLCPLRVRWASGTLFGLDESREGVTIRYDSPTICYVALNRDPREIWIDGAKSTKNILTGEGEWILCLPSGKHGARIRL
jgi:uncharacterized protein YdaL